MKSYSEEEELNELECVLYTIDIDMIEALLSFRSKEEFVKFSQSKEYRDKFKVRTLLSYNLLMDESKGKLVCDSHDEMINIVEKSKYSFMKIYKTTVDEFKMGLMTQSICLN